MFGQLNEPLMCIVSFHKNFNESVNAVPFLSKQDMIYEDENII